MAINMPDAASQEFAAWYSAYSEVTSTKAANFLQGGFKPSLQNNYNDLFSTKHGITILNTIKAGAPILANKNIKTKKKIQLIHVLPRMQSLCIQQWIQQQLILQLLYPLQNSRTRNLGHYSYKECNTQRPISNSQASYSLYQENNKRLSCQGSRI